MAGISSTSRYHNGDVSASSKSSRWLNNDDEYLKSIEQYKTSNPDLYAALLNNPWMFSKNLPYEESVGDMLAGLFGSKSGYQQYYQDLLSKQNQYVTETVEKFRQQKYDSAAEQAARERAAGLNPDLTGNVTPGAAAENDQPMQESPQMGQNDLGTMVGAIQTGVSTIISVYNGIAGAKSMFLDNKLKQISLNNNLRESAWNIITQGISENIGNLGNIGGEDNDYSLLTSNVAKYFDSKIDRLPYSNWEKRHLKDIASSLIFTDDKKSEFTANFQKSVKDAQSALHRSRNEYAQTRALPGATQEFDSMINFYSDTIYKPMTDLSLEIDLLKLRLDKGYYKSANELGLGSDKAQAESVGYSLKKDILNIRTRITKSFEKINRDITGSRHLSPLAKFALEAGAASVESLLMSKLAF